MDRRILSCHSAPFFIIYPSGQDLLKTLLVGGLRVEQAVESCSLLPSCSCSLLPSCPCSLLPSCPCFLLPLAITLEGNGLLPFGKCRWVQPSCFTLPSVGLLLEYARLGLAQSQEYLPSSVEVVGSRGPLPLLPSSAL